MAKFTLSIETEEAAELRGIVDRIAGVAAGVAPQSPEECADQGSHAHYADPEPAVTVAITNNTDTQLSAETDEAGTTITATAVPERDAHGIKRDERIHANAAEPFKADGCWKRRKNLTDDQYDAVYLELAREAIAAGVYAGPTIPELALEDKVVDTEQPAEQPETTQAAPAPVAEQPAAAAAPAPVQAAAPAPTPGMSAQTTPTASSVTTRLMLLVGSPAVTWFMGALNIANFGQLTPEQLRTADEMITALGERVAADGARTVNTVGMSVSSAEWKAANGVAVLTETARLFGLVA